MLAHPKRAGYPRPASVSLHSLRCVVTKMGYNQTRVCRRVACPSGASDNVPSSPQWVSPIHSTIPIVTAWPSATICSVHCPFLEQVIPIITVVSSFLCKGFPAVWSENLIVVCLMTSVLFGEHSGDIAASTTHPSHAVSLASPPHLPPWLYSQLSRRQHWRSCSPSRQLQNRPRRVESRHSR